MTDPPAPPPEPQVFHLALACRCFGWIGVHLVSATSSVSCAICGTPLSLLHQPEEKKP